MSNERKMKLLEAFSGVDEELLERCESAVVGEEELCGKNSAEPEVSGQRKIVLLVDKMKQNFKKSSWWYGSVAAAVVCLIGVGAIYTGGFWFTSNDNAAYEAVMDEMTTGAAPANGTAGDGAMMQDASSVVEMYQATADSVKPEGDAETSAGSEKDSLKSASGTVMESVNGILSGQTNDGNTAEKVREESAIVESDTAVGCQKFTYVTVSEAEARAHGQFGSYIPTNIPEGYGLEGAYVSGEGEVPGLMVSWSRGLDSIMVNITLPKEAPATVDVTRTETYDEYLYEIPHTETVPEDYREVFQNPVCAWEDFSLEFVQKRMIAREDAGDTDTPRGNFSVLYPDGVLVHFNGRGTAVEIWEMFGSMEASKQ